MLRRLLICLAVIVIPVFSLSARARAGENDSSAMHYMYGVKFGAEGKFTQANEELQKALEAQKFYDAAIPALELAGAAVAGKVSKEVAQHLFQGISFMDGLDWFLGGGAGEFDATEGQALALVEFNKAIELEPKFPMSYLFRGKLYDKPLSQRKNSVEEFSKAIECDPNYATAYYWRGLKYRDEMDDDKAAADLEKVVEVDKTYCIAYHQLGDTYKRSKLNKDKVIPAYEKFLECVPATPEYAPYRKQVQQEIEAWR